MAEHLEATPWLAMSDAVVTDKTQRIAVEKKLTGETEVFVTNALIVTISTMIIDVNAPLRWVSTIALTSK